MDQQITAVIVNRKENKLKVQYNKSLSHLLFNTYWWSVIFVTWCIKMYSILYMFYTQFCPYQYISCNNVTFYALFHMLDLSRKDVATI